MNKVYLNTVSLAKEPVINKGASAGGSGSGVTIKNQDKSLEIVENGTTEVTADAGFTGLGKVIINTNVPTSGGGGGGGSDMPVIGDGKTYLYITIADEANRDVRVQAQTSGYNGTFTIDWGDGTITENNGSHTYAEAGDYVITLTASEGYTLLLGNNSSASNVLGSTSDDNAAIFNKLRMVEIGTNVSAVNGYAFYKCAGLTDVYISDSVTKIGTYAFAYCCALTSLRLPSGAANIESYAFGYCYSLKSLVIPEGVTSIGENAFYECFSLVSLAIPKSVISFNNYAFRSAYGLKYIDFSQHTEVPTISSNTFYMLISTCKIIVPDALYDEWIAATNWSSQASKIIKKSDWDASQS